ncbi:hypothetical protein JB92DRAFT_2730358 [Gautieria morchelliformis]|nr:hypothetical protein JB92DRAFT_2730358 [Gautieria morchelliformis]
MRDQLYVTTTVQTTELLCQHHHVAAASQFIFERNCKYQSVLDGTDRDGMFLTYDKGSNDQKVQSQGSGGLEGLEEDFSDGRIQYAFVRVKIPMYVPCPIEICNWCWDGVPEAKKGLFRTHSSTVGRYLEGTPVVVDASTEPHSDVSPALIMKRVRDASGAKYSVHNEATRSADPIAPVGTNSICGARSCFCLS